MRMLRRICRLRRPCSDGWSALLTREERNETAKSVGRGMPLRPRCNARWTAIGAAQRTTTTVGPQVKSIHASRPRLLSRLVLHRRIAAPRLFAAAALWCQTGAIFTAVRFGSTGYSVQGGKCLTKRNSRTRSQRSAGCMCGFEESLQD